MQIDEQLLVAIVSLLNVVQTQIQWKPNKDVEHLQRRIRLGQLPIGTTLTEYEQLIMVLLNDPNSKLYLYYHGDAPYPLVMGDWTEQKWAVIIGMNGVMETAFALWNPQDYIERRGLIYVGSLEEVIS